MDDRQWGGRGGLDTQLRIDAVRMRQSWEEMAGIGAAPGGGVTRLALSDSDAVARNRLMEWYRQAQLEVRIDDVGTVYGWRRGVRSDLPPVAVGSHLDTVLHGGRFDGVLGVLAALEIVRT